MPEDLDDIGEAHLGEAAADAAGAGLGGPLLEHLLDLGDEEVAVGGLPDEVEDAELEGALGVVAGLAAGEDDPGHVLAPGVLAGLGEQGEAVLAGEFELADHDVDLAAFEHASGLLGAAGDLDEEALLDHAELEDGGLLRVRVDEEGGAAVAQEAALDVVAGDRELEEVDEVGVEDRLLVAAEDLAGLEGAEGLAEGVPGVLGEVRVGVGDGQEAAAEGDILALGLPRGAVAVVALVHGLDGGEGGLREPAAFHEAPGGREGLLGGDLVALVLGHVERRQVVGPHLVEVMEVRRGEDRVAIRRGQADALAHLLRQPRHLAGVAPEIGPGVLDEADEDVEGVEVRLGGDRAAAPRALGRDVLGQGVRRQGALPVVGLRQVPGDLLVAQQVTLVHVEHRRELLVGGPVEDREGVDIPPVGLRQRRLHRRRARDEGPHLLEPGGEPQLPQRLQVVRVRGHHRQHVRGGIVEHREDLVLLGEAPRDLVQRQPVDVRLGELLGADKAGLVHRRDELQQVVLGDGPDLQERLLDAASHPVELREGRLVLPLVDLSCLEQQISEPVVRCGAGGCRHIPPSIPQTSAPRGAPTTTTPSLISSRGATGAVSGKTSASGPGGPRARCPRGSRSAP